MAATRNRTQARSWATLPFRVQSINMRAVAVIGLAAVYALAYAPLYSMMGPSLDILVTAPVVVAAWLFGRWAGLVAGLLTFPLNFVLKGLAVDTESTDLVNFSNMLGSSAEVFVGFTIGLMRDLVVKAKAEIAERSQVEAALRESEARYAAIYDNTPIMMHSVDRNFRLIAVNRSWHEALGYTRDEVIGRNTLDFMTEESRRYAIEVARPRSLEDGFIKDAEFNMVKKNGEVLEALVTGIVVKDDAGDISHSVSFLIDVGERRRAEKAVRVLRRRLAEVQEAERRHIARELHDEIGQELTGLRLLLEAARTVAQGPARSIAETGLTRVDGLIDAVRDLSLSLRPSMLDDMGLLPALLWLIERHASQGGLVVDFEHGGLDSRQAPEIETAAYRIVQEGLTNVARHAATDEASLFVWADGDSVRILIEDSGAGFDPSAQPPGRNSIGLAAMRERVELLGGRLSVDSSPGDGTRLSAELPLQAGGEIW